MTIDLDPETRGALVDELKKRIPEGAQKRIGIELASVLGNAVSTGESKLSRLLNKHPATVEQLLGPEIAETVLGVFCKELHLDMADLLRAAQRAAWQRPRPAPDRHPAWQELGEAAPWVDKAPGMPDGMETLRAALSAYGKRVVWLVGPAGSGKSARLWRAQQAEIGRLVDKLPDDADPEAVWLVDKPDDPDSWIVRAVRCKARLVIATRAPRRLRDGESQLELSAWTHAEAESFLGQLAAASAAHPAAFSAVALELIADKVAELPGGWTPLDLGHLIRLFVDEPALLELDAYDLELRIRSELHGMLRRADLSPDRERLWMKHGRHACAVAATVAVRGSTDGRPIGPLGEAALRAALAELAGVMVGGQGGAPLRVILDQARRACRNEDESGKGGKGERDRGAAKQVLDKLDVWARSPSGDDLFELLVELGAWRHTEGGTLVPSDEALALSVAAERLDDDWMWRRLRATLADPEWAMARVAWAPGLGQVVERLDELLATDAAVHVGAIELAVALIARAREPPRPDQVERAMWSAVRLLACETLVQIGLSSLFSLRAVLRSASRRHRRTLPPVTVAWTRRELEQRCTEGTRRVIRAADGLAEDGPEWLRTPHGGPMPDWYIYARLMPWQALPALQDRAGRRLLLAADPWRGERPDWEAVVMDHAADGHVWARAVATGDVEDIQVTIDLVSIGGLLRALGRWPAPCDPERHEQALAIVLNWLPHGSGAARPQLHTRVVHAIVDFIRRHPDRPLPNIQWLQDHEGCWREALDQAAAVRPLRTWFDREREALARGVIDTSMSSLPGDAPGQLPTAIANGVARLLRLGETLHRHSVPAPLRGLVEQTERRPHFEWTSVEWELGSGAADALLRLRDAASLRSLYEPYGSARSDAVRSVLSRKSHDEDTVLWIADHLGDRYDEVLESIVGRPERREIAKRWALDASFLYRRHAAAGWLLRHPAAGEVEHVRWLLTELAIPHSLHYVEPALAHRDEDVGAAAIALLPRALDEVGAGGDLAALVRRSFHLGPGDAELWFAMTTLARYLEAVNASGRASSPDSIRTLIALVQRYLATASEEEVGSVASGVCASLAFAACRLRLAALAAWVREPFGACADVPASSLRGATARAGIVRGICEFGKDGADLDPEVLHAVADTDAMEAIWARSRLLDREAPTEAQLLAEWSAVSDAVLVEKSTAPARFYAVQDRLRRLAPRRLARALADRLLALPPELRRLGVSQISQVAMLDAGQASRLSPLFD